MKLAEEKKQGVRDRIKNLRDNFTRLLYKNQEAEEWVRLT